MRHLFLTIMASMALLLPSTAASRDAFGLNPYVIGDFAPSWEAGTPVAWPVRLWGSTENFDGLAVDDAWAAHWSSAFWLRTERFAPGQSLYIQAGSNDAMMGGWEGWEGYEASMWFIVTRALELGIEKVVIVSSPHNFVWAETPILHSMLNDLLALEAEIDRQICAASEDVYCVDVFGLLDSPDHYLPDGIRLSDQGHETIADEYLIQVPEPSETLLLVAGLIFLPLLQRASRKAQG